jgi:NAD+ kinase
MNRGIRKIGFIFKRQDARVPAIAGNIVPFLQSRGIEVLLDRTVEDQCQVPAGFMPAEELVRRVDIVGVFGGDGTLLYAARLIGERDIPILGVNLGTLGFLTEVKPEAMYAAFDCLLSGQYQIQERMFLHIEVVQGGSVLAEYLALNDAVINKGALARIVELEISVDAETALNARSDGLIISSPTGSTAYSLASGGPILYPTIDAFTIASICPHALSNRPLVIPDSSTVSVFLKHGSDVMLTVDGQIGVPLEPQTTLNIRKAKPKMQLVLPFGNNHFRLLREKLRWG